VTSLLATLVRKRDFYAGGVMVLLGAGVIVQCTAYNLGTLMHMGPGFFPMTLGVILTLLGLLIMGTAALTPLSDNERILPEQPEWRGWICIILSPLLFIFCGIHGGMAPATFACVFIAALGDRTATLKGSFLLAAGVTFFGVLLFAYLLKVPFPIFRDDILSWSNWFGWVNTWM
jgi:hypothetical protein